MPERLKDCLREDLDEPMIVPDQNFATAISNGNPSGLPPGSTHGHAPRHARLVPPFISMRGRRRIPTPIVYEKQEIIGYLARTGEATQRKEDEDTEPKRMSIPGCASVKRRTAQDLKRRRIPLIAPPAQPERSQKTQAHQPQSPRFRHLDRRRSEAVQDGMG